VLPKHKFSTKSQISIFVIIGIVLVIVTAFIVIKINQKRLDEIKDEQEHDELFQPVVGYVNNCIKETAVDALQKIGDQGLIYPKVYLASKNTKISYFYFKGEGHFPEENIIENQVGEYIGENIMACIGGFSRAGFVIDTLGKAQASVLFKDKKVKITLEYPMKVYAKGEEFNIKEFSIEIKINFQDIYKLSKKIYLDTMQNPEWINFDFLYEQPFDIKLIKIDKSTLVYEITDTEYGLENKPYRYRFAVKFGF
jgi:hypothetical protein